MVTASTALATVDQASLGMIARKKCAPMDALAMGNVSTPHVFVSPATLVSIAR